MRFNPNKTGLFEGCFFGKFSQTDLQPIAFTQILIDGQSFQVFN